MKTSVIFTVCLACLLIIGQTSFSQTELNQGLSKTEMLSTRSTSIAPISHTSSGDQGATSSAFLNLESDYGMEGSMYLFPAFVEGILTLTDGNVINDWKYRYDMRNQKMQFLRDGDTLAFGKPEEIRSLIIDEREFIYTSFKEKGRGMENAYFEILTDGKCKLLLKREITHHYVDRETNNPDEDVYITQFFYYIKKGNKPAKQVVFNRKKFVKEFDEKDTKIAAFIDDNNLKCKNVSDLALIVDYLNSIED